MGFLGFSDWTREGMVSCHLRPSVPINLPWENEPLGGEGATPQGHRAGYSEPGCLSDRDSLPHTVTKPCVLYAAATVMGSLRKYRSIIYQRMTAASMSLGKSPALLPTTTQFILCPTACAIPISGNAYCCVWSIQRANKLHRSKIQIKQQLKK